VGTLKLGKVIQRNGFSYLNATVNGPGIIKATGPKIETKYDIPMSKGTSRLVIKANKASRTTFRRTGKLQVKVTVRFRALAGGELVTRTRVLALRKK